jgi:hypothetical protein
MKQRTPTARKWECFLSTNMTKTVDPQVDELWRTAFGKRTPFGDLRNQWRRHHCRTLNPYGSETCPYQLEDCALAFLQTVRVTTRSNPKSPVGYFLRVAKSEAAKRADNKPLRRGLTADNQYGSILRTGVPDEEPKAEGPGITGPQTEDSVSRQRMRSAATGPISIGDLLGQIDPRPHQGSVPHREESTE